MKKREICFPIMVAVTLVFAMPIQTSVGADKPDPVAMWELGKVDDTGGIAGILPLSAGNFVQVSQQNRLRVTVHNLPANTEVKNIELWEEDWSIFNPDDYICLLPVSDTHVGSTWTTVPMQTDDPGDHAEFYAQVTLTNKTVLWTPIVNIPHGRRVSKDVCTKEYTTDIGGDISTEGANLSAGANVRFKERRFKVAITDSVYYDPLLQFEVNVYETYAMKPNQWKLTAEPREAYVGPGENVEVCLVVTSTDDEDLVSGMVEFSIATYCNGVLVGETDPLLLRISSYDPPIWGNTMAFPVPEQVLGSDLNKDNDTEDAILHYKNFETGEVVDTDLIVFEIHHAIDVYQNIISFVGESSQICYYNTTSGEVRQIGRRGTQVAIHGNVIAFSSDETICYFDLNTQTLVNTGIPGNSPAIYGDLIAFTSGLESTIWTYDLRTGTIADTGIAGKNPTIYGTVIAFETSEHSIAEDLNNDDDTNDVIIRYYDVETRSLVNTMAVGIFPSCYGNRIVFATPEEKANDDLNRDGRILGDVIRYYDLNTGEVINTQILGTEPDIHDDMITFCSWEEWAGQDHNGDGDLDDPILGTYQVMAAKTIIGRSEIGLFMALLVGSVIVCLRKRM